MRERIEGRKMVKILKKSLEWAKNFLLNLLWKTRDLRGASKPGDELETVKRVYELFSTILYFA